MRCSVRLTASAASAAVQAIGAAAIWAATACHGAADGAVDADGGADEASDADTPAGSDTDSDTDTDTDTDADGDSGAGGSGAGGTGATGATGDTGQPSACTGDIVHYAADVEPILLGCGGNESCHQLTLGRPGAAIPWLVDVPTQECGDHRLRVAPGDPDHSYLVDKLLDRDVCEGSPMPKPPFGAWSPLPQPKIDVIVAWICGGALDD